MPAPDGQFISFTAKSDPPGKQLVLRTQIGVRQAVSLGKPQQPQAFVAIWDTGASATCISPKISKALGLAPISMTTVHAAGNSYDSPVYRIDVFLPNRLTVIDIRATEAANIQGADMLLGMDVITTGDLSITNANNDTWFSFRFPPARAHIDYAEQQRRMGPPPGQGLDRQNMIKHLKKKGKLR
jgi:hypothetical protein